VRQGEPRWLNSDRLRPGQVPAPVLDWLLDQGSLTRRVQIGCSGVFRVRLLHQAWGRPLVSESRLLRARRGQVAIVREVELRCGEQPRVFARTLIPASSLKGSVRRLARLAERPLGAVLFADRRVRRGLTQIACLRPKDRLFGAAAANLDRRPDILWGRRTLYYVSDRPLLVNEIFLSGLFD
jgi:chorismate--pyruvate lyase